MKFKGLLQPEEALMSRASEVIATLKVNQRIDLKLCLSLLTVCA